MPDWYRTHGASPDAYPDSEYTEWAQDNGLYVDAAGNVDYGPPGHDDWDEDGHQRYKDGVATGQLNPDGSQREPDEPDFAAEEYERHCEEAHGGEACDCPPDDSAWELPEGAVYDTNPPF